MQDPHSTGRRPRICEVCDASYTPTYSKQRTCGRACGVDLRRREGTLPQYSKPRSHKVWLLHCEECDALYVARQPNSLMCSEPCKRRRKNRTVSDYLTTRYAEDPSYRSYVIAGAHNRRGAGHVPAEDIHALLTQDNPVCGICQQPIQNAATIDHKKPLAKGGLHTLNNMQLAHEGCNAAKGTTIFDTEKAA